MIQIPSVDSRVEATFLDCNSINPLLTYRYSTSPIVFSALSEGLSFPVGPTSGKGIDAGVSLDFEIAERERPLS